MITYSEIKEEVSMDEEKGILPISESLYNDIDEENQKLWQPVVDAVTAQPAAPASYIPKGFTLMTEGPFKGFARPSSQHDFLQTGLSQ